MIAPAVVKIIDGAPSMLGAPGSHSWAASARLGLHSVRVCRRPIGSAVVGGKRVTGGVTHAYARVSRRRALLCVCCRKSDLEVVAGH
jgi:hypothetical protein